MPPLTEEDAAALHRASSLLWNPLGEAYVALVAPAPGDRVLDACCGAGASAIPAARAVGASGAVDAVDLAPGPAELGRRRAAAERLGRLRFHVADVTAWPDPEPYDVLLCGYGIFFMPDMDASARRLAGRLRPGGRFSVATWAEGALESFGARLARAVETERPLESADPPARRAARRIGTEDALGAWARGLRLRDVRTHRIVRHVPLSPGDAWDLVLGSGFRGMLHSLDAPAADRVRARFLDMLDADGIDDLDATSLVAVGTA
ncbi:methyltransferase domain-containing protein [Spirillospora sp. NPDC029432]|uniref:class I SAM-dependent methyltransferase n=1 Tax=Spirillospora sp. NPDC029432 TaxID=3154599 RepID=UPI0034532EAC